MNQLLLILSKGEFNGSPQGMKRSQNGQETGKTRLWISGIEGSRQPEGHGQDAKAAATPAVPAFVNDF